MPTARLPEPRAWSGSGWRAVEAQHRNATMALVGGRLDDQALLEEIVEQSAKPHLPAAADGLHYLLATPFRYRSPAPHGSRFRGPDDAAVFYGAEDQRTACAEAGYWRLRFWMDSAGLAALTTSMEMSLFEFHGATNALIDLTEPPLLARRKSWIHRNDYRATQALARSARAAGVEVIRSESVRNPTAGRCLSILTPQVFKAVARPFRERLQTWSLFIRPPDAVVWTRQFSGESFEFVYA